MVNITGIAEKLPQNIAYTKSLIMATISYELGKSRKDKTRKVSIILSHKGQRKRIPTNIVITEGDLYRSGKIKSANIKKVIDDKINTLRSRLYDIDTTNEDAERIYSRLSDRVENLDFFEYAIRWIEKSSNKGKSNYGIMLNSLRRFCKCDKLPFSSIDYKFLTSYNEFLAGHPRAQSLYLGCIRHLFNEAMREYNTDSRKIIANNPFNSFTIPKDKPHTNDRVINEEDLVKVFNFKGTRRVGMARDCYVLSFCLIGMNSVDLYECTSYKNGILSYNRAKTRDRRIDNAHIEIVVPDVIKPLFKKYNDTTRVFCFHNKYSNAANFNKHINKGLHKIADTLGIPHFDFYSARHTWASIARNRLGIDKYTIHEALNHVSDLDITDIYIQRDYTNINKVNAKVIGYIENLINPKNAADEQ